jgi:hypothetical protein
VLRDSEGLKRLDRIPPVLRRAASLTDCVLVSGVGGAGDFEVTVRRTDGLAGVGAFGSRTEVLLCLISLSYVYKWGRFLTWTELGPQPCGRTRIQNLTRACRLFYSKTLLLHFFCGWTAVAP